MPETEARRSAGQDKSDVSERHLVETASVRRRRSWLAVLSPPRDETLAAILLGVAALATAWSSYQASVWGGIQAAHYSVSSGLRTRAARAAEDAARLRLLDLFLFTKWLESDADNRRRLASYYRSHFRPELVPAFEAWQATGADRMATSTPFERPEYQVAATHESRRLDDEASRAATAAQHANDISDGYVFDVVILASVLFFAGAVRPLVSPRARGTILFMGLLLCVWALMRLANEPVARLDAGARPLLSRLR
jgi:hypothetical protein